MKKFLLIILSLALVAVIAVAGGLFYLSRNIDTIIKEQAEEHVPLVTGTSFQLEEIKTKFAEGSFEFYDLTLGNPKGFPEGHSLRIDSALVQLDIDSLSSEKIIVKSFILNGLDVVLIKRSGEKNNLEVILDNVKSSLEREKLGESGEESAPKEGRKSEELRLQVDLFEINRGHLLIRADEGVPLKAEAEIPQAKLTALGAEGEGITFDALIEKVALEIAKKVEVAIDLDKGDK